MTGIGEELENAAELEPRDEAAKEPRVIPNSSFDPDWYLSYYSDVRESGMDATYHYLEHGIYEGRHATALAWQAACPSVADDERRDLVGQVCRIISGSDADGATIDRYHRSLTSDLRSVVEIARELINERNITQRVIALERKLQIDRRMKMRPTEPAEVPNSFHRYGQSPWGSRDKETAPLGDEDLDLLNILNSRKTIDMGESQERSGQTEDGPIVGRSLADLARGKRSTILASI